MANRMVACSMTSSDLGYTVRAGPLAEVASYERFSSLFLFLIKPSFFSRFSSPAFSYLAFSASPFSD